MNLNYKYTDRQIEIHYQRNNLLEIKRQESFFEEINLEIIIFNYLNREY